VVLVCDDVEPGNKAIFVKGNGSRRDADVLAAAEHRRYTGPGDNYHAGIVFWTSDGTEIVNFPKQHSANCTAKHQAIAAAPNWLLSCETSKLVCAKEMYFLLHPTSPVTWKAEKMQAYLEATVKYWNSWT